jgi:hypothetical protein
LVSHGPRSLPDDRGSSRARGDKRVFFGIPRLKPALCICP